MACFRALALVIGIVAIATIFMPSTMAMDYVVGDDKGWTQNIDYQAWAQGKQFFVGDTLGEFESISSLRFWSQIEFTKEE